MTEEKFLYYIGAGASAKALPTVNPIVNKGGETINIGFMQTLYNFIRYIESRSQEHSPDRQKFLRGLMNDTQNLINECTGFATIDTYAKFLHITDKNKLQQLKKTLTAFFVLHQAWEEKIDKRYLNWLTSILDKEAFPDNIKIVNWNYDYQFQLAACKFREEVISKNGKVTKHSPPLIEYFPSGGWSGAPPNIELSSYSLIHLNGLAGWYYDDEDNMYNNFFLKSNTLAPNSNLNHLVKYNSGHGLNFAWEGQSQSNYAVEAAKNIIVDTTIVIIIGYSFPFFNRNVDKQLFEVLKSSGKLRKIYFQDPVLDGSFLRAQFDLNDSIEIIHIPNVESFYIPFEL